jgi:hypothetical protein
LLLHLGGVFKTHFIHKTPSGALKYKFSQFGYFAKTMHNLWQIF